MKLTLNAVVLCLTLIPSATWGSAVDPKALENLVKDAQDQHSNALFVYQAGAPVRETFFNCPDKRVPLFSVTKLFTGLAIGILWDKGLIPSPEVPIVTYYPEIKGDQLKSAITLRHLLQQTSGIFTTAGSKDIYPQADRVKFALESPMVSVPGEKYEYNNRAYCILSGVVKKVSGKTTEEFLVENLFKPLEIQDYDFKKDKAGNTWANDGLALKVSDLIKVACVLADGGNWKGKRIISEKWLALMFQPPLLTLDSNHPHGLGVLCVDLKSSFSIPSPTLTRLEQAGVGSEIIARLKSVAGRSFGTREELAGAIKQQLTTPELEAISASASREMVPLYDNGNGEKVVTFSGEIGEYIIALPVHHIAVARTIDWSRGGNHKFGFDGIYKDVLRLVGMGSPVQK